MADGSQDIVIRLRRRLADTPKAVWDGLANPDPTRFNPFVAWDFLEALEASGCASDATGWAPHHLIAESAGGETIGAAPLYLKTHSYGEFVFDHSWANALERAGGRYYPKLQASIPFTPASAPKRLIGLADPDGPAAQALARGAAQLAESNSLSSAHWTFLPETEAARFERLGYLIRTDQQFHFRTGDFRDFQDVLDAMSSGRRKTLRKEREKAKEGLVIRHQTGGDLTASHWDAFFDFYLDTGERKWGQPYLNRRFFELIHDRMADRVLMVMAWDKADPDGAPVAAALNFIGGEALYGRYWGRREARPFLHFELCYYQAIDFALDRGLARVEAGAQGGHKLARGYAPATTFSAHWITDPRFRRAVADYLEGERAAVAEENAALQAMGPFRADP